MDKIKIVAHRGGAGPYTENTLEAFQHAIETGCGAVEMDIRFDNFGKRFFLEHDFFHPPKQKQNVIDRVIPLLPRNTAIFAELKTVTTFSNYFAANFAIALEKFFNTEKTLVISFNPFVLLRLQWLYPKIEIGFLCGNPIWNFIFRIGLYRLLKPGIFLLHNRLLGKKNVEFGRKHHMKVYGFVLNDEKHWQKALDLKLDGIITDFPTEARKFLEKAGVEVTTNE